MFTLGICGAIAGIGLMIFGTWEGIFGLSAGIFLSIYGMNSSKAPKNLGKNDIHRKSNL